MLFFILTEKGGKTILPPNLINVKILRCIRGMESPTIPYEEKDLRVVRCLSDHLFKGALYSIGIGRWTESHRVDQIQVTR